MSGARRTGTTVFAGRTWGRGSKWNLEERRGEERRGVERRGEEKRGGPLLLYEMEDGAGGGWPTSSGRDNHTPISRRFELGGLERDGGW
jgi:hypothetical protein